MTSHHQVVLIVGSDLQSMSIESTSHTVVDGNLELGLHGSRVAFFPKDTWVGVIAVKTEEPRAD